MAEITSPIQLFTHKLGAALTMEQAVLQMLQKLEQEAKDPELKEQFSHHRDETADQVKNLQQAFSALGKTAETQPCPAIDGLKEAGEQMIGETSNELIDAVLLGAAAETEHHEIAVYDGLITHAEQLGEDDIVALLEENLEQEEHALKEVEKASQREAKRLAEATPA